MFIYSFHGRRLPFGIVDMGCYKIDMPVTGRPEIVESYVPLPLLRSELNHAIKFDWAEENNGAAQLAYCILRQCGYKKSWSRCYYQKFKRDVIKRLDPVRFTINEFTIYRWCLLHELPHPRHSEFEAFRRNSIHAH